MSSNRMKNIKQRLFDKEYVCKKEWWGYDKSIFSCEEVKEYPLVIRKALAIEYTMRYMPAEIKPDELIVGMRTQGSAGLGRVMPEYALPEEEDAAAKYSFSSQSIWGHSPAKFQTIVDKGIAGICMEIDEKIAELMQSPEPVIEELNFYQALRISIQAVQELADRYARLAFAEAKKTPDPVRKKELLDIARVCSNVPRNKANSFHESLQSVFFLYCALHSTMDFVPLGRVDQFLYPYYKKDIDNNVLTEDQAHDLVGSWIAKFAEVTQVLQQHWEVKRATKYDFSGGSDPDAISSFVSQNDSKENYGVAANNVLNNIILGGMTPDGECAVNDLTYIILEEWAYLEPITPVVSVRFNDQTPEKLFKMSAEILRKGSGEPAIYNDNAIIEGFLKLGIPLEVARNYSNDGCWELLIPGETFFSFDFVELGQMLEYVLTKGVSLVRGTLEADVSKKPEEYKTFPEFYNAFICIVKNRIDDLVKTKVQYYKYRYTIAPSPLLSAVMDNCIEKGNDAYTGGAKYNLYTMMLTEASTCIDSLAVIKKFVFEDATMEMNTIVEACKNNFHGYENLRQMVLNECPKYGNDEDYVDEIGVKILKDISEHVKKINEDKKGEIFTIGLGIGTFEHYQQLGYGLGASPDGRCMHDAVASNFSPSIGVDLAGPTAAINSIAKMNLNDFPTGCMLDLQINSNEVKGEEGIGRMIALMKAFMALGGQIITLAGVNEADMLDAQIHPEKHRNLRVRIGGFSAYFISLTKEHQDIMIQRVKHSV